MRTTKNSQSYAVSALGRPHHFTLRDTRGEQRVKKRLLPISPTLTRSTLTLITSTGAGHRASPYESGGFVHDILGIVGAFVTIR
jgi:hypothetical protein